MKQATFLPMADLAKYICSLDASLCRDPNARFLLQQFQRDCEVIGPGAAHRRAVKLLESLGADLGPEFHQPLALKVAK